MTDFSEPRFDHPPRPLAQRVGAIAWPSFFAAGVATMVFFAFLRRVALKSSLIVPIVGIMLGAVECSFKREIPAYKNYEMWSRILSWDRKWLYIATHYVPKGTARPKSWLDPRFMKTATRGAQDPAGGWEKKIYATAISKYVIKLGRFTVHPAIVLGGAAGLLPERPGGWTTGEQHLGDLSVDLSDIDLNVPGKWDWRRVEAQRRKGMELAGHFHELDRLQEEFDGGDNGALGQFTP